MAEQRLHKYLAYCGVGSRRAVEKMIRDGLVSVNGEVVTAMGVVVNPETDRITVAGEAPPVPARLAYYALHKPIGVISTAHDERGRKTVLDLLPASAERVYPVGRLDADSEGLMLLTNDGKLAAALMHPRHNVPKTYLVTVKGSPTPAAVNILQTGVELEDGITRPAQVRVIRASKTETQLEFVLREGRKRQIRRMCAAVGHPVLRLVRTGIGPLSLGRLQPGTFRKLSPAEVAAEKRRRLLGMT